MTEPDTSALGAGFRNAQVRCGLSKAQVLKSYAKYRTPGRKMLLSEFLAFGLYDPDLPRQGYIGAAQAALVAGQLNSLSPKRGIISDKLMCDAALRGMGYPVPELQAVFGPKAGPNVVHLMNRNDLRKFLTQQARFPIFGKPLWGQNSRDVIAIAGYDVDQNELLICDGSRIPAWSFFQSLETRHARWGYLFQTMIAQDPVIEAAIGKTVGTVRVVTFLAADQLQVLGAFWKIPTGDAPADNLWRGSMVGALDDTGQVTCVMTGIGPGAETCTQHPDTGADLQNMQLPHWASVLETVQNAAQLFSGMPLIGWDIAITPTGAVIVEANGSPSLELLQVGQGQGILTPTLEKAFRAERKRLQSQRKKRSAEKRRHLRRLIGNRLGFGRKPD